MAEVRAFFPPAGQSNQQGQKRTGFARVSLVLGGQMAIFIEEKNEARASGCPLITEEYSFLDGAVNVQCTYKAKAGRNLTIDMQSEVIQPHFTQQDNHWALPGLPPISRASFDLAMATAVMCEAVEDSMLDTDHYKLDGTTSKELIMAWAWEFVCASPEYVEDWYDLVYQFAQLKYTQWAGLPYTASLKTLAECHPAFAPYANAPKDKTPTILKASNLYCFPSGRIVYIIRVDEGNRLYVIDQEGRIDQQEIPHPDASRIVATAMTIGRDSQNPDIIKLMFQQGIFDPYFKKGEAAMRVKA